VSTRETPLQACANGCVRVCARAGAWLRSWLAGLPALRVAPAPRTACIAFALALATFATASEARRLALVVGNDSYKNVAPLKNARSDAKAIADALQTLGFDVTLKQDLTLTSLKSALREFKTKVGGGDEVIFYFSGHGVQFEGTNYLVPTDIVAESEAQVEDDAVPLQRVLDDLRDQKARFALAIVDACRDNPFKGQGRAIGGRGLAPVQAANGQMVLYSAGAGQSALDRLGPNDSNPNGVFTRVLIKQINRPGVPVDRMLKNVRDEVVQLAKSANHEQVPAIYDQSIGDFYFKTGSPDSVSTPSAPPPSQVMNVSTAPAPAPVHVPTAGELDELFWGRIRDSTDPDDFKEYTKQFPKGVHAAEASLMARKLAHQQLAASKPATAPASAAAASAPANDPAPATPALATPDAAEAALTMSVGPTGSHPGYITSTLLPGTTLTGGLFLNPDGTFSYQGSNGVQLHGLMNTSNAASVSGTGIASMPKKLGFIPQRYPDGSVSTPVTLRGKIVKGMLQGQYATKFETGLFVFNLSKQN
jgi:hypothetical protein